ncbi:MAG TPA: hypothetical protein VFD97_07430 [Acidimicrobiia bacterium]|nr:hypothetical protein [Acidimicrobiia bacterium]
MPESQHKSGEEGLDFTKRWLESTTWVELGFDAYTNPAVCTLERLDGKKKVWDLFGSIFHSPPTPLYVENKAYNNVGSQPAEYLEFLANAYSHTAKALKDGPDPRYEFMWVTTHPFDQTAWPTLTSPERIKKALDKDPGACGEGGPDLSTLSLVSNRVWLLVLHERQNNLLLTPSELSNVEGLLNRKGKT